VGQAPEPGQDEAVLLALLPADGASADGKQTRSRLGWDAGRYANARDRLQERGYILAGPGPSAALCRALRAVPPEFRPACGRPGAHVMVQQVPVTVSHALCDLTGVILSCPGRGGATVPACPGDGVATSTGLQLQVDPRTQDVTVTVTGAEGNA
jgi:hypothetical protein